MTKYRSPPVASSRLTTFGLQCTLSFNLVGGGVPPKEGHSSLLCVYMTYTQSVTFLRLWGRQLPFLALLLMAICLPPFLLKGRYLSDVLHVYQYQALDFFLYSFQVAREQVGIQLHIKLHHFYVILNLGRIQDTQARTCTHIHTQSCIELTCDLQNALRCFVEGSGVLQQISLR